ncbi:MAG: transposase [Magnetococcales bacterium]|nr:transposase [Magnetococcales bacterium]
MPKKRKNHTAQEKTAILREHLINKVPISNLCDRHGIQGLVKVSGRSLEIHRF